MRLYGVRRLSEMNGRFYVHVRCQGCQRRTCFLASDLEALLPMRLRIDADLDTIKERLTCKECKSRQAWVWSDSDPMDEEEHFDDLLG